MRHEYWLISKPLLRPGSAAKLGSRESVRVAKIEHHYYSFPGQRCTAQVFKAVQLLDLVFDSIAGFAAHRRSLSLAWWA
jgi:hypothetical protein